MIMNQINNNEFFQNEKPLQQKLSKFILEDKQNLKYQERFLAAIASKEEAEKTKGRIFNI